MDMDMDMDMDMNMDMDMDMDMDMVIMKCMWSTPCANMSSGCAVGEI